MQLQVKIDFRRPSSSLGWLFVFVVEFALLISRSSFTSAQNSEQTVQAIQVIQNDATLKTQQQQQAHERKCVPMLNIVLPQQVRPENNSKSFEVEDETTTSTSIKRPARSPHVGSGANFTFAIGDIELPLTQAGSPIGSAMRLLSSFDSSFGDEDEEQLAESSDGTGGEFNGRARENSMRFVQNKLLIADLNLTMLNFHLYQTSEPRFGLGVNIGNATLMGKFFYDGLAPSLMGADLISRLAGHYRMSIDNVLVTATSNLTKLHAPSLANATTQQHRLVTNDFKMNITNLGYISIDILDAKDSSKQTSNYVLKMLQRVLQKTIKRTYSKFESYIRDTLETEARRFLDCELTRFSPILRENQEHSRSRRPNDSVQLEGEQVNNLDDLARIISSEMRNSRFDRVPMPSFEHQRSVLGTNALIVFTNGSLSGLDNLRLLGETKIKIQHQHLLVNASLGWFNLRTQYNWTLYLGQSASVIAQRLDNQSSDSLPAPRATARGFVAANIKVIEFETLISRSLRLSPGRVTVDELNIRRLEGPKMDIGGLPGMNRLARATVNFFMARLKQRLVSSLQPSLKTELERVLNKIIV